MPGRKSSKKQKSKQAVQKRSAKRNSSKQKSAKKKSHSKSKRADPSNHGKISKDELIKMKIIAYCMSCKSKNDMEKKGRKQNEKMNRMIQGMCCGCGGKVATILKKNN